MDYKGIIIGMTFLFIVIFTGSCTSNGSKSSGNKTVRELPETGKIHSEITCSIDPAYTYTLYLPMGVKPGTGQSWPVIIAFDPHGSGLFPVQKYRELAEKYGYILIGSDDSKNGQTAAETRNISTALFTEIINNYPSDTSRIYLAGFSGGSRVASLVALTNNKVRGVIGCGAGFPGLNRIPDEKFDYFGCVGLADFNLNEMVQLDNLLTKMSFRHFIITFDSTHAWPPGEIMEEGILWLTFNAMKDRIIKTDQKLIDSFRNRMDKKAKNILNEGKYLEAASIIGFELNALQGLADTTIISKSLTGLKQTPAYNRQSNLRSEMLATEQNEQQMMTGQLFVKDAKWWKNQISKYEKPGDVEENMKNKRLLSFLSLLCYSNANAAMKQYNTELSLKVIDIYELADPGNPEPNYLRAILFMHRNDTTMSMNQLQKAVSKGFSDKVRVMQQKEFQGLKEYRPYFDLLQKIK